MCKRAFVLVAVMFFFTSVQAQTGIVFNKTEHDFGLLSSATGSFEQDFLFRNTGQEPVVILSARSIHSCLSFIHTRSEVFAGEYGFVKVKFKTDSLRGLFHDEVYITLRQGNEVVGEVIYLRAHISADAPAAPGRAFQDSPIATSVEVSPEDIETLEGFSGRDRLAQAEAEIGYLRRQVALKGDLVEKLSADLQQKQLTEEENIKRLENLEKTLRNNGRQDVGLALEQVSELTDRLLLMQKSDSVLRVEIHTQEKSYLRLKHEADSARQYAERLSSELQQRFKTEAQAIEKANRLERNLKVKLVTEQQQKQRIDSLENILASGYKSDSDVQKELEKLKTELAWKQKEQQLQSEHARHQHEKIEQLKREKERFQQRSDSLSSFLSNRDGETKLLYKKLEQSTSRISDYEKRIDSLEQKAALVTASKGGASLELDSVKKALASLELADRQLKETVANKDAELMMLQSEKQQSEKDIRALELATTKQLEEAHNLMYRINQLSTRESQARMEMTSLRQALKKSESREDSARAAVALLAAQASEKELSLKSVGDELVQKERELNALRITQETLRDELTRSRGKQQHNDQQVDSLKTLLAATENRRSLLETDVTALQRQIVQSQNKEKTYLKHATELESQLANARLSNELAFEELKTDIGHILRERDDYKNRYQKALEEIENLNEALAENTQNGESVKAGNTKARTKTENASDVIFRVNVLTSDQPNTNKNTFKGFSPVYEYRENGKYRYAIGQETSMEKALELKEKLKASGFSVPFVVAFKNGSRISLKEALETAQR